MPIRKGFCVMEQKYSSLVDFTIPMWYSMCSRTGRMVQGPLTRPCSGQPKDSALHGLSDEELMQSVQAGNGDAFAILFDRFHRLVLITALKIVRDVSEAEEVTQNVFFEIYRAAEKFDASKGTLKVWLLQYAYHRSINRRNYLLLRQFYNRPELEEVLKREEGIRIGPQISTQEITRLIRETLTTLNDAQRRTIEMVFFEGLALKDVAEKTNESLSNVRNHYYRGLERLRLCLTEQPGSTSSPKTLPFGEVSHARA
jgi:RNA polymerase sigma-70 factor (ECF subfamily)